MLRVKKEVRKESKGAERGSRPTSSSTRRGISQLDGVLDNGDGKEQNKGTEQRVEQSRTERKQNKEQSGARRVRARKQTNSKQYLARSWPA